MSIRKLLFIFITCPVFAENINLNWVVDNETYANTTCSYGNDVNLPAPPQKSGYTFVGWKVQNYIPVEYIVIQSTSSSAANFIDTKIGKNDFTYPIIEMRIQAANGSSGGGNVFFRTGDSINTGGIKFGVEMWTGQPSLTYGRGTTSYTLAANKQPGYTNNALMCYNKTLTYRIGGSGSQTPIYVDGNLVSLVGDSVPDFSQLPITDTIRITDVLSPSTGTFIYLFKISDIDGTVLFDGVPAKDLSGNACLYDNVTNKCFYMSGNGILAAGPEIE